MDKIRLYDIAGFCGAQLRRAVGGREELWATSVSTDTRTLEPGSVFVALRGENFDGHGYLWQAERKGAVAAVVSDGAPACRMPTITVPDTGRALLQIARGYRLGRDVKIAAVTGSAGKTSTKEMIYSVLSRKYQTFKTLGNLNNEIGVPLTLLSMEAGHRAGVVEMGMNHFGEISRMTAAAAPDVAVITNIGVSHMEFLGSREGVARAKLEILEGLRPGGTAVLNGDEPLLRGARVGPGVKTIYFGVENPENDIKASDIQRCRGGVEFNVSAGGGRFHVSLPVPGAHNVYNALAAAAVGLEFGVGGGGIAGGLGEFESGAGRQRIFRHGGITLIDDTYNASPDSMKAALRVLKDTEAGGKRYAVLGSMMELGERSEDCHAEVGEFAARCADRVYCCGIYAESYRRGALKYGGSAECFKARGDMVSSLKKDVMPGDAVLFKGSRAEKMEEILKLFVGE